MFLREITNKTIIVYDDELGAIHFPKNDSVMVPFIQKMGTWDPNEFQWLQRSVKPGDSCLNIGANVGYFTILMSMLAGETGSVNAFEPNQDLIKLMKKNLSDRNIDNVKLHEIAVGDKNK